MHVTYIAHLLHSWAMLKRAHFKNIDHVVATTKAATIENKDCKKHLHKANPPSPFDLVITRWATWLRAALYYSEYFPATCIIVNNWTGGARTKEVTNMDNLVPNLVNSNDYRTLAGNVEFLKVSDCTMTETYDLLKNMQFRHDSC